MKSLHPHLTPRHLPGLEEIREGDCHPYKWSGVLPQCRAGRGAGHRRLLPRWGPQAGEREKPNTVTPTRHAAPSPGDAASVRSAVTWPGMCHRSRRPLETSCCWSPGHIWGLLVAHGSFLGERPTVRYRPVGHWSAGGPDTGSHTAAAQAPGFRGQQGGAGRPSPAGGWLTQGQQLALPTKGGPTGVASHPGSSC